GCERWVEEIGGAESLEYALPRGLVSHPYRGASNHGFSGRARHSGGAAPTDADATDWCPRKETPREESDPRHAHRRRARLARLLDRRPVAALIGRRVPGDPREHGSRRPLLVPLLRRATRCDGAPARSPFARDADVRQGRRLQRLLVLVPEPAAG